MIAPEIPITLAALALPAALWIAARGRGRLAAFLLAAAIALAALAIAARSADLRSARTMPPAEVVAADRLAFRIRAPGPRR